MTTSKATPFGWIDQVSKGIRHLMNIKIIGLTVVTQLVLTIKTGFSEVPKGFKRMVQIVYRPLNNIIYSLILPPSLGV